MLLMQAATSSSCWRCCSAMSLVFFWCVFLQTNSYDEGSWLGRFLAWTKATAGRTGERYLQFDLELTFLSSPTKLWQVSGCKG